MNYFSYNRELSRLSKKKDEERKELSKKIEKARKEEGPAKAHEVASTECVDLDFILEDIAILKTNYLQQKLNKTIYQMPTKPFSDSENDFWQESRMTGEWYLKEKGYIEVHHLLEKANKEKREKWSFWAFKPITVITALIMVLLGIYQLILARSERLDAADALLNANEALKISDELKALTEFQNAIVKAQVGDRKSFGRLTKWFEDTSYPYNTLAAEAISSIWTKYSRYTREPIFNYYSPIEAYDIDLKEFKTIDDISDKFNSYGTWIRVPLIQYVWNRDDIPKNKKIPFLINVLKHDKHLDVFAAAGIKLNEERKAENKHPLAIDDILKWWEENKDNYK